jgi:CheY-like chemotaxis protein
MTAAMPSSLEASPLETEIQRAPAPDQPGEQEPVLDPVGGPGRRVLLAEDSPITQDLLKLLLNQRGHQVDVAMDGEQALEALRRNTYDVALLDFHLPKMDGLQVAAAVRSQTDGRPLPRLIAITADVEGLLAHAEGCDNFDLVMPKPLDIYQVGRVVEEQGEAADLRTEAQPAPPTAHPAAASRPPEPKSPFETLGFTLLTWPGDIDTKRLSARAMQATLGDPRFDGILVKVHPSPDALGAIWRAKALYVLPIIDLRGTLGRFADIDGSKLASTGADQVGKVIREFQDRRERLDRDLLFSEDLGEQLIGRLFVSNRPLTAGYDPRSRNLVAYDVPLAANIVIREAEALCSHGLLKREFFDRFHVCPRCESFRLHVREECVKCRSSHLKDEQYLHHFSCAFQGPEDDFRQGDSLICPKCRQELTHFGFDYDRPGTMVVCQDCAHAVSDPTIGFVCVDCGGHVDSDAASTRDVYTYHLTDQGKGFAEHGRSFLGYARHALRFAELPLELVVALNAEAKRFNDEKVPFTLLNILYRNELEIISEHGARTFAQVRDLFLETLRTLLDPTDLVVKGQTYDFALLAGLSLDQARADFDLLAERASETLRYDLGVKFQGFGPEDFS